MTDTPSLFRSIGFIILLTHSWLVDTALLIRNYTYPSTWSHLQGHFLSLNAYLGIRMLMCWSISF